MTGYIHFSNNVLWKLWSNLEGAVREGTHRWSQTFGWEGPIFAHIFQTETSRREFLLGMHGFGVISSPHVVGAFDLSEFCKLVDLGGATGHLVMAACRRYPQLRGILFDLADVTPLADEMIASSDVANRIEIVAGDFFSDSLPEGDLFALGRILHDWNEQRIQALLNRVYERLPEGGGLLIAEKLLWEDRLGPRTAHMQDLNMLVCTEGRERTLNEYASLLERAGFAEIRGSRTASPVDAILARKCRACGSPEFLW